MVRSTIGPVELRHLRGRLLVFLGRLLAEADQLADLDGHVVLHVIEADHKDVLSALLLVGKDDVLDREGLTVEQLLLVDG
ncbi:hypothetical protein FQZ97_541690 [compost metagenome]